MVNTDKIFTLAINQYINQRMKGQMRHPAIEGATQFHNLMDLAQQIETVLDHTGNPMRTTEMRHFQNHAGMAQVDLPWIEDSHKVQDELDMFRGKLATIQLVVKYRYHASWQGELIWKEKQETHVFRSFLEMTCILGRILQGEEIWNPAERACGTCKVAVDTYQDRCPEGCVMKLHQDSQAPFNSSVGLVCEIKKMLGSTDQAANLGMISNQAFRSYRRAGKKATFTVRILFTDHGTWQGTICWCEEKTRISFRSFLEMLLLMNSVLESENVEIIYEAVAQ